MSELSALSSIPKGLIATQHFLDKPQNAGVNCPTFSARPQDAQDVRRRRSSPEVSA
jgi:hypothetical protein